MLTDEERMQAIKESVDSMIAMNRRYAAERGVEQKRAEECKAAGKRDAADWAILLSKVAIGIVLLMFCVLMYIALPTIINAIIEATTQWQALFH